MNLKIIGIDPSGNFFEGKGTTGWCILSKGNALHINRTGSIEALDYVSQTAYWQAHIDMLDYMLNKYKEDLVVSMEDFLLYAKYSQTQVNSHFETPQLIGVIKMWCHTHNVRLYIRPAVVVMKRWNDDILIAKKLINKERGRYSLTNGGKICTHEVDSIRHAVHCAYFEVGHA